MKKICTMCVFQKVETASQEEEVMVPTSHCGKVDLKQRGVSIDKDKDNKVKILADETLATGCDGPQELGRIHRGCV